MDKCGGLGEKRACFAGGRVSQDSQACEKVEEIDDVDAASSDPFVADAISNERDLCLTEEQKRNLRKIKEEDDAKDDLKLHNHLKEMRLRRQNREAMSSGNASSLKAKATTSLAIEITGKDRPGLFSEISAALADMGCNIIEAHAWSHNALLACVAYISGQSVDTPIDDRRLHAIEDHLTTVLRATTATEESAEVKPAAGVPLPKGELGSTTRVERRLHQLMLEVCDFDSPSASLSDHHGRTSVAIERCLKKGYSYFDLKFIN